MGKICYCYRNGRSLEWIATKVRNERRKKRSQIGIHPFHRRVIIKWVVVFVVNSRFISGLIGRPAWFRLQSVVVKRNDISDILCDNFVLNPKIHHERWKFDIACILSETETVRDLYDNTFVLPYNFFLEGYLNTACPSIYLEMSSRSSG